MRRVRELEIWSKPGRILPAEFGKDLAQELRGEGVAEDVILGLSNVPHSVDLQNLRTSMQRGELAEHDYLQFCAQRQPPVDPTSPEAACLFLELSFGRALAWLHAPEDQEAIMIPDLFDRVERRGLVVVETVGGSLSP